MTGVSTLTQSLGQINRFTEQQVLLDSLTTQLASGKKTQKFSGLDTDVLTLQRSRASIKTLDTYVTNITHAERRMELMLSAIEEFKAQAENFSDFLAEFNQAGPHQLGEMIYFDDPMTAAIEQIPVGMDSAEPDVDFRTLIDFAGGIFDVFTDLMNEKDGDRYLFAGAETLTQPLPSTATLDTALTGLIDDWKTGVITTADLIADLEDRTTTGGNNDALTDTVVGYSSALSSGNTKDIFVQADNALELDYTVLANQDPFRDILVAVAYFKNETLPPVVDQVDPDTLAVVTEGAPGANADEMKENFYSIFRTLTASVNKAIDDIDQVRFGLETTRARMSEIRQFHIDEKNLLQSTVSDIEDVDLNQIALSINTLSIQLDASFRVTARTSELSLVNFF